LTAKQNASNFICTTSEESKYVEIHRRRDSVLHSPSGNGVRPRI
jgi:hypothetical protein